MVKNERDMINNRVKFEKYTALDINMISARRFIVGGAAMLAAVMSIHHNDILGATNCSPFVINSLRV